MPLAYAWPVIQRPSVTLPDALVSDLWRMNPWWEGGALPLLPPTRRYLVDQIHPDWYEQEILGKSLNEVAHQGVPTYLFFDEIQNLKDWAPRGSSPSRSRP